MQKDLLQPKVALVTGGARRIGAEIIHSLHQEGMNIVLHYDQSHKEAAELAEALNKVRPHSVVTLAAPLQVVENINFLIKEGVAVWGRLNVLVNNASRFYRTHFGEVTETAWQDLMDSNLKGPFFLSQAAAPYLAEVNGCIINITDIHAERPLRDYSVYCLSKAGLTMMTKLLAKELGPKVRVNAVAPGAIIWPEGQNELGEDEKNNIVQHTLLKRSGEAQDIANAVLFFVRDATYVTGQILNVDGGRSLCS